VGGTCNLGVSAYGIAQSENTVQSVGQAVFTITNGEDASTINLVSLSISGPNGTLPANPAIGSTNGLAVFTIDDWVSTGSSLVLYEYFGPTTAPAPVSQWNFEWIPGQVYQVNVLSAAGVTYSASFTAP
jgi:hypothetical protein